MAAPGKSAAELANIGKSTEGAVNQFTLGEQAALGNLEYNPFQWYTKPGRQSISMFADAMGLNGPIGTNRVCKASIAEPRLKDSLVQAMQPWP
jgi:hypothetical protein